MRPVIIYDDLTPRVDIRHRVGRKCVVTFYPEVNGVWVEAGGFSTEACTAQDGASTIDADILPEGCPRVDHEQARIYYFHRGHDSHLDVRIPLPGSYHFRSSAKGRTSDRAKSFDSTGTPVHQVVLLYALKRGRYDERVEALMGTPHGYWIRCILEDGPWGSEFDGKGPWDHSFSNEFDTAFQELTLGDVFRIQDLTARDKGKFEAFIGRQVARDATRPGGLSDWLLWEKVADQAVAFKEKLQSSNRGRRTALNHARFVQAVKDSVAEYRGLPCQLQVRERWEELGGEGEWKEIRKTLGFDWIPSKRDWEKNWPPDGAVDSLLG
jgi:hypothetical protein